MTTPLYSIGTWDMDLQAFTPQDGIGNCFNITLWELRKRMRELRNIGYSVHRRRDGEGCYDDNDYSVLVERTDGMNEMDILNQWER